MYITDYFRQIEQIISNCPAIISKSILFDQRTKYKGNKFIFRYDNHPHPTRKNIPYYHKHVFNEENIIPASVPNLEDILKEIIIYLP